MYGKNKKIFECICKCCHPYVGGYCIWAVAKVNVWNTPDFSLDNLNTKHNNKKGGKNENSKVVWSKTDTSVNVGPAISQISVEAMGAGGGAAGRARTDAKYTNRESYV